MAVMTPEEAIGVVDQKFKNLPRQFGGGTKKLTNRGIRRGQNRGKVRNGRNGRNGRRTRNRLSARKL